MCFNMQKPYALLVVCDMFASVTFACNEVPSCVLMYFTM